MCLFKKSRDSSVGLKTRLRPALRGICVRFSTFAKIFVVFHKIHTDSEALQGSCEIGIAALPLMQSYKSYKCDISFIYVLKLRRRGAFLPLLLASSWSGAPLSIGTTLRLLSQVYISDVLCGVWNMQIILILFIYLFINPSYSRFLLRRCLYF